MFDDVISEFTEYLYNVKKVSSNTVVSYCRDIRKYCDYLEGNGISDSRHIHNANIKEYVDYLQKKGFSDSTISRNLASLKCFSAYLSNIGQASFEIGELVKAPKVAKKTPEILTLDEVERLLAQPTGNKPKQLRDKAMLELMYATGVRVSELIMLRLSDVNLNSSYITCRDGNKHRVIPFGSEAKQALENYLNLARPTFVKDANMHLLFTNCKGTELSRQGFWKLIKSYSAKAGIDADITPHTLRHSFAAHLIENGADIHAVSEMLGHSDISSTKIYVNMNNDRIRAIYSQAHPRK